MAKVQISINDDLLKNIDEYSSLNYISRSAFFTHLSVNFLNSNILKLSVFESTRFNSINPDYLTFVVFYNLSNGFPSGEIEYFNLIQFIEFINNLDSTITIFDIKIQFEYETNFIGGIK